MQLGVFISSRQKPSGHIIRSGILILFVKAVTHIPSSELVSYLSLLSRIFKGNALKGICSFIWHLWTILTYTSPEVEKRSRSGEGREDEQAITEVFAVWDMLEIQYDSHQSEIFLDATEKDRLRKEKFYFQISKYEEDKLKGKLLDNFFRVLLPSIVFPLSVVEQEQGNSLDL